MISVVEYIKARDGIPISSKKLAEAFGVTDFDIRKVINQARSEGIPICSCRKGYYYSEDENEIQKTVMSLAHRIGSIERAIRGLSTCIGGQE